MTDPVDAFRHWEKTHNRENYGRYDAFAAGAAWQLEQMRQDLIEEIASTGASLAGHIMVTPKEQIPLVEAGVKALSGACDIVRDYAKQENAGPVVGRKGDQGAKHEGPTASSLCPGCGYPWTDHVLGEQGSSVCEPKADPNQDNAVCPKRSPHGGHFEAAAFPGECFYCSKKMRAHEDSKS